MAPAPAVFWSWSTHASVRLPLFSHDGDARIADRTFTDYPPSCPSHNKAYTTPQMTKRAATYVSNTSVSYRKGVCVASLPIFYETPPASVGAPLDHSAGHPNLAAMAHTSLFRWVTTLGEDKPKQTDDAIVDFSPARHKYLSERRRTVLIACRATCHIRLSNQVTGD